MTNIYLSSLACVYPAALLRPCTAASLPRVHPSSRSASAVPGRHSDATYPTDVDHISGPDAGEGTERTRGLLWV